MRLFRTIAIIGCMLATAGAAVGQVTIPLDSRQAFLHVDPNDTAQPAPAYALAAYGLAPGQTVRMEPVGDFDNGPGGDEYSALLAVFSSSATLLAPSLRYRVPGALSVGENDVTGPTPFSYEPTDIPEDFYVTTVSDTLVIPVGATHLFVSPAEVYYIDNTDPDGDFGIKLTVLAVAGTPVGDTPVAAAPVRLSAYPNPFNPQTTIAFELGDGAGVLLSIHDLGGRRVRTLVSGGLSAGRHAITWDGCDDAGRGLASGSYLARLDFSGRREVTRLSLVR